eukprot:COSAG02_NODE_44974_length_361_cov_0.900763_1_plen_25_part_10
MAVRSHFSNDEEAEGSVILHDALLL